MDSPSIGIKLPDVFTPKQKLFGFLGVLGVFAGGGTVLYKALPWLTELFTRATDMFGALLALIGLAVTTVIILFVLSQKQTWAIGRTLFNVFARMAAKSIAKAMPAEVCETYLTESMVPKLQHAVTVEAAASGLVKETKEELVQSAREIAEFTSTAQELARRSFVNDQWTNNEDAMMFNTITSKLTFCEEKATSLANNLELFEAWKATLTGLRQYLKNECESLKFYIEQLVRQYEMAVRAAKVARQVGGVIGGDSMKEMYDMSVAFMKQRIHQSMGEVESVMSMVKEVTAVRNLKDSAASRQLLDKIRASQAHTAQLAATAQRDGAVIASGDRTAILNLMKKSGVQTAGASTQGPTRSRRLLGN